MCACVQVCIHQHTIASSAVSIVIEQMVHARMSHLLKDIYRPCHNVEFFNLPPLKHLLKTMAMEEV